MGRTTALYNSSTTASTSAAAARRTLSAMHGLAVQSHQGRRPLCSPTSLPESTALEKNGWQRRPGVAQGRFKLEAGAGLALVGVNPHPVCGGRLAMRD